MTKSISLTQGKFALVDDQDFDWLNQWKWFVTDQGYAGRSEGQRLKQKTILMHRVILNPPQGMFTDHINNNRLDNRRENLRACTPNENRFNSQIREDNQSGFIGVSLKKSHHKWVAQIQVRGHKIHLGLFDSAEKAAKAYDLAAGEHFGIFAKKNFPDR